MPTEGPTRSKYVVSIWNPTHWIYWHFHDITYRPTGPFPSHLAFSEPGVSLRTVWDQNLWWIVVRSSVLIAVDLPLIISLIPEHKLVSDQFTAFARPTGLLTFDRQETKLQHNEQVQRLKTVTVHSVGPKLVVLLAFQVNRWELICDSAQSYGLITHLLIIVVISKFGRLVEARTSFRDDCSTYHHGRKCSTSLHWTRHGHAA